MATAGRAILFSGLTVAIGLAGLLFYTGTALVSMGIAGAIVVAISVLYGVTLLPAMLAILGRRINSIRIPILQPKPFGEGAWHRLATWVMRRPWLVLIPTVAILLVAGSPFLDLQLANSDVNQLPTTAEARQGADLLQAQFPQVGTNTIAVVVDFDHGAPTESRQRRDRVRAEPAAVGAQGSHVDPQLRHRRSDAHARVSINRCTRNREPRCRLRCRSVLTSLTGLEHRRPRRRQPVLRDQRSGPRAGASRSAPTTRLPGATVKVTGDTAFDIDLVDYMINHTPLAIGFVLVTTLIVLTVLLRSVVLPFKAVLMNALSLSAAFGALVWIFDQGHLSGFLGFTPGPLDPTIPVLLFCVVFGLSMDYEVFLLTRMQEAWHPHRRQPHRGRRRPRAQRPARDRRRGDHGVRLSRVRARERRDHQVDRHRHGGRGDRRRHAGSRARGARADAPARQGQLVGTAMAATPRPRTAGDRSRSLMTATAPHAPLVRSCVAGATPSPFPSRIAGAITLVVISGGDIARHISLAVYGVCPRAALRGERDVSPRPVVGADAQRLGSPRPRDHLRRDRRHVHAGRRQRPERLAVDRAADGDLGARRIAAWSSPPPGSRCRVA